MLADLERRKDAPSAQVEHRGVSKLQERRDLLRLEDPEFRKHVDPYGFFGHFRQCRIASHARGRWLPRPFRHRLTAKTHVSRILTQLGARDRVQLVLIAYQTGIVDT